jgi:uncharacterized membrane protein YkvA (DUF1232 family)
MQKLKFINRDLKRDLAVYQLALKDPRTPRAAKLLLSLAVAYSLSPFDLIPDFIPLIGHMDDALIVPFVIRFALKLIPDEVMDECRLRLSPAVTRRKSKLRSSKPRRR